MFDEEYGRAKAIEVHVGYHGSHSDVRKSHEVRKAVCVAVHRDWYNGYHRPNDLAMIRLQHPFDQMFPLGLKHCPLKADITTVQVVGYPMDVPGGMEGHFMYKSIGPARWGLEENSMLIYRLDTAKGKLFCLIFFLELLNHSRQLWLTCCHARGRSRTSGHRDTRLYGQNPSS